MLYSAVERDPFFNRLVAVRWPEESAAFDIRLRETSDLFDSLERWPHVWVVARARASRTTWPLG